MIAYLDSSVLARVYLQDESDHHVAVRLLEDSTIALITGTWSLVEVSGAIVRAGRAGRCDAKKLLAALDTDLRDDGPVKLVSAPQPEVETRALRLVREHGIRALDAWHLGTAVLVLPGLAEPGEEMAFATRDSAQAEVAGRLGFKTL